MLFAISSVQESLDFTPFELVFGHEVRGPLEVVKDNWSQRKTKTDLLTYVTQFKERLENAVACASTKSDVSVAKGDDIAAREKSVSMLKRELLDSLGLEENERKIIPSCGMKNSERLERIEASLTNLPP